MTAPSWDAFEVAGHTKRGILLRSKWDLTYETPHGTVVVPKGTLSDGASIPKIFWSILGPHGPYFLAAFLHDYAYSKEGQEKLGWTREMADMAFDHAMEQDGVWFIVRLTIIVAVRSAGWIPYRKNRKNV